MSFRNYINMKSIKQAQQNLKIQIVEDTDRERYDFCLVLCQQNIELV